MTDTFAEPFTVAPLAPAPLESLPEASIPGSPVKSDWSGTRRDLEAKVKTERRSAIDRARWSAEAGWSRPGHMSKAERLAQPVSDGTRDTGSGKERVKVLDTVRRAMAKVEGAVSEKDFALSRKDRDDIRQRWGDVGEFVKRSEQWEKEFKADPVATREKILAAYAGVNPRNFQDSAEPEKAHGVRGSIRQAQREHADLAALSKYEAKYGKAFPQIVAQLNQFDKDLANDPVGVSARLAANAGAPVTEAQQRVYEAKQAADQAHRQETEKLHQNLEYVAKNVPGLADEPTWNAIADILESKDFKRSNDPMADLGRAHGMVLSRRANSTKHAVAANAGSKSISGAPSTSGDAGRGQSRSQTAVGAAVSRAFGRS